MLYVYFGEDKESVLNVPTYFKHRYKAEWFEDKLVKEMVKDVDKSDVLSQHCIQSPVLGQIPPERLSGGVKTLILLLKEDKFYPDLVNCGENCCKWLYEVSKIRDIKCSLSGVDLRFEDCQDIEAVCLNDNTKIYGAKDWTMKMVRCWYDW